MALLDQLESIRSSQNTQDKTSSTDEGGVAINKTNSSFFNQINNIQKQKAEEDEEDEERSTVDIPTDDPTAQVRTLQKIAQQEGVDVQQDQKKDPGVFRTALDVISRPLYASAGAAKALFTEGENPLDEAIKGFKGEDKETYSDVLDKTGVENDFIKGAGGFVLDVALDPSTYFGGTAVKGALGAAKFGAKTTGKAAKRLAPRAAKYVEVAGENAAEAFNRAFRINKIPSDPGVTDDVFRDLNVMNIELEDLRKTRGQEWTDILNDVGKEKAGKAAEIMRTNKRLEFRNKMRNKVLQGAKESDQMDDLISGRTSVANERQFNDAINGLKSPTIKQAAQRNKDRILNAKEVGDVNFKEADDLLDSKVEIYAKSADGTIENGNLVTVDPTKAVDGATSQIVNVRDILLHGNKTDEFVFAPLGQERKFLQTGDADVQKAVDFMTSWGDDIAEAANIDPEDAYQFYWPGLKKDKDVATKIPGVDTQQGFKKSPEHYKKEFKDLLPNEEMIEKPFEAYTRVEMQATRNNLAEESMNNLIKTYGKTADEFAELSDVEKAKYNPVYPKGKAQIDVIPPKKKGNLPQFKGFEEPMGYLKKEDFKFVNDYMFPEKTAADALAKSLGYDKFTNFFKTAVYAYFPSSHARNVVSGTLQNYQVLGAEAFRPRNHNLALGMLKGKDEIASVGKWSGSLKDLRKKFEATFKNSTKNIGDLGDTIQEYSTNKFKFTEDTPSFARKVGDGVEMHQKAVATIGALRQGKTVDEALKLAEEAGFNYQKITNFERKVMKRLIPFYTFTRKNAELQLKTIKNRPEKILNITKFADALSNTFGDDFSKEDIQGLPSWVTEGLGFKIDGDKVVSQLGFPLEEFTDRLNNPMGSTLSSMNPIIKYPAEAKMGYDFFRQKKIQDIDKIGQGLGEPIYELDQEGKLPSWFSQALNIDRYENRQGDLTYTMSPNALHFMRNIPTARFQSTLEKLLDEDIDNVDKLMGFFSGAKIYEIDQEKQKFFRQRELKRDIEDKLLRRGIGDRFDRYFVRKEELEE